MVNMPLHLTHLWTCTFTDEDNWLEVQGSTQWVDCSRLYSSWLGDALSPCVAAVDRLKVMAMYPPRLASQPALRCSSALKACLLAVSSYHQLAANVHQLA